MRKEEFYRANREMEEVEAGEAEALLLQANPGPMISYHYCDMLNLLCWYRLHVMFAMLVRVEPFRIGGRVAMVPLISRQVGVDQRGQHVSLSPRRLICRSGCQVFRVSAPEFC